MNWLEILRLLLPILTQIITKVTPGKESVTSGRSDGEDAKKISEDLIHIAGLLEHGKR